MPAVQIHGAERQISKVFSDEYEFEIPDYQRPYAWDTEQAGELLSDLLICVQTSTAPLDQLDPYFLGSLVLIKDEAKPASEVVDGQQRLITLTLLFAVLHELMKDEKYTASLSERLFQSGDALAGIADRRRLLVRERDRNWFDEHVGTEDGISKLNATDPAKLKDYRLNVRNNSALFYDRLRAEPAELLERLAKFLYQNTFLVIVSTPNLDSAYRIFSVLNERGLDLTHADILKAGVIGRIADDGQRSIYSKKWENEEEQLGAKDFADLFSHIRMVFAKSKARESVLKEFREVVLTPDLTPEQFVDNILIPLSDQFEIVRDCKFESTDNASTINQYLRWLNLIDNADWIPPVIEFLRRHHNNSAEVLAFLVDLDRLAASMHLRRVDLTRRVERYGRLLTAVEGGGDLYAEESPLQLSVQEQADTVKIIDGEVYPTQRTRLYIVTRLDSAISEGVASYDWNWTSVEHVLPQSPLEASNWRVWFTDEERDYWLHRLANLVLLGRRKNAEASNYDFDEKKQKYFTSTHGVAQSALITTVLAKQQWTPAILADLQRKWVAKLAQVWRLDGTNASK